MPNDRLPNPDRATELMRAYERGVVTGMALTIWRASGNPLHIADAQRDFDDALAAFERLQQTDTP